jgi:hypothetical protein
VHEQWKILDKFDSTYWSGLDVQLYANNVALGEALQLSYIINEQVRPYYGYSSYVPDRIYHGSRLIQGEISLNFKRDGYIFSLLKLLSQQDSDDVWLPSAYRTSTAVHGAQKPIDFSNTPYGPQLWEQIVDNELTPEQIKAITKKVEYGSETTVNTYSPDINTSQGVFETRAEGFDLNIVFGGSLSSTQTLRALEEGDYSLEAYREWEGAIAPVIGALPTSTGLKIIGVSIMNVARTIADDGRPVVETYSFQAKDIVVLKNVGNTREGTSIKPPVKKTAEDANTQGFIGPNTGIPFWAPKNERE